VGIAEIHNTVVIEPECSSQLVTDTCHWVRSSASFSLPRILITHLIISILLSFLIIGLPFISQIRDIPLEERRRQYITGQGSKWGT